MKKLILILLFSFCTPQSENKHLDVQMEVQIYLLCNPKTVTVMHSGEIKGYTTICEGL